MTSIKNVIDVTAALDRKCLFHKRKGILKIDQSQEPITPFTLYKYLGLIWKLHPPTYRPLTKK